MCLCAKYKVGWFKTCLSFNHCYCGSTTYDYHLSVFYNNIPFAQVTHFNFRQLGVGVSCMLTDIIMIIKKRISDGSILVQCTTVPIT